VINISRSRMKRTDDLNIHLDRSFASQHRGQHGYAVFGENVRRVFRVLASPRVAAIL
jgi:hypothetical protein